MHEIPHLLRAQRGVTTAEYLVIGAVLVLGLVAGVSLFKSRVGASLGTEGAALSEVASGRIGGVRGRYDEGSADPSTGSSEQAESEPERRVLGASGGGPPVMRAPAPTASAPASAGAGLSSDQLTAIIPELSAERAQLLLPYLNAAMSEAEINTPKRQAAFIAQVAHESGGLQWFQEFASGAAYEGRKDLGNTKKGDGKRYKGRGPIQLTGRVNYHDAGEALGLDLEGDPDSVATPEVGFRAAAWFWNSKDLNSLADADDFDGITYRVNGGYRGKKSRDAYHARALGQLGQ